ncbi:FAD-binding protein [Altererythrobacter sp. ZODW24]|uniref:FAD-dependent oxidoreductase n=1 Tax=Altererythrobacter sp. ZODW24 TaxID=2185142 RepID=UPI000DF7564B|nr:FAD-binding protein [Altererythrobacter sp. ZODW24]
MSDNKDDTGPEAAGLSGISRRDAIKVGAITAATLAVPTILNNVGARSMSSAPKDRYAADLVIIGTGFAGVFAAVEARRQGLSVIMLDKGTVGWSGLSPWASDSRPFDPAIYSRDEWHHNVATNTEWVNDRKWLDIFMDESLDIYETLRSWGVHECKPFERSTVFRDLLESDDVTLVERTMVTSLLQDENGKVGGVLGFTFDDSKETSKAVVATGRAVIMCSGAGAYKSPGFPNWGQTFDGDAMAYEAGATITGKEYHDTHLTFSGVPAASYEGWVWAQSVTGAYIMVGPPDPVVGGLTVDAALRASTGNINRVPGGGPGGEGPPPPGPNPEKVRNEKYRGKGFLATEGLHLDFGGPPEGSDVKSMGFRVGGSTAGMGVHKGEGVFNSDYTCRADGVDGLYAAGDALGSQLCGSSYPGRGFSSYGSAIQGRRAAKYAAEYIKGVPMPSFDKAYLDGKIAQMWAPRENEKGFSPDWVTSVLQNTMTPFHILYLKEERRLEGALASIEYLRRDVVPKMIARDGHELRLAHETASMLLNAEMKLRAGIYRTESRGTHFREDYPARNDAEWLCWVLMKKDERGEMALSKHMLPKEWAPDPNVPYRERYPRPYPGEEEFLAQIT